MLSTLKYWGYVEQILDTQKYCLGLKVAELGMVKIHNLDLFKETNPFLQQLAKRFDETANLGVLEQKEVFYLDKVESTRTVKAILYPGRCAPVHCTALGKALLAFQLPEVRKKIVGKKLKKI